MLSTLVLMLSMGAAADEGLKAQASAIAIEYSLDPTLFVALVELESNFQVGAYNSRTMDYGLTQVNAYNVRAMGLDADRLLTDPQYNLRAGAQILAWFKRVYAPREPLWFCRYNVGTGPMGPKRQSNCLKYVKLLNNRIPVMVAKDGI